MIRIFLLLFFVSLPALAGARPPISRASLVAPIIIDGQAREQAWVFPSTDEEQFLVEAAPLLLSLSPDLVPQKLESLRAKTQASGVIPLRSLREIGLAPRFDTLTLELTIQVPPQAKRILTKSIVAREESSGGNSFRPSAASAYLNLRTSQPFQYPATGPSSRLPFGAALDFAGNFRGTVLSSGATYSEHDTSPWKRQDTALIHDSEAKMLRFTAGDQVTPSIAYLTGKNIGGLGVSRVFAIQPNTTTQPISRTEVLLKRPSQVDVIVNGTVQNQLHLPAGPVNIQDFPLASGFNNVTLKITDDLGKVEYVNLTIFYDAQALGEGVQSFSYHVGAPSAPWKGDRRYDSKNLNFSFFHRAGFSDRFTGGIFGQGDEHQNLLGLESILIGKFGSFSFTPAVSRIASLDPDFAGRLRYQTLDGYRGQLHPLRFSFESEYKGWRFAPVGVMEPANPYAWSFDAYTLYRSAKGIDFGMGGLYQLQRSAAVDRWQGRSDISALISSTLRASLNYSYTHDEHREHRAFFTLTWVEPTGQHYANASYDYPSKTERLDLVRTPSQPYDDVQLAAGLQHSPTADGVSAQAEYTAQRANFRLDHQSTFPTDHDKTTHLTTAGFATALVWAGSSVSISRPVYDSFAIFPTRGAALGESIPINSQGDSAEAYAGSWLPAVVPNLNSYYQTPVSLDTSRLPPGVNVEEEYFRVKPTYKSGVEVLLGSHASATAVGILVGKNGKPLALASGEILTQGSPGGAVFFTNKQGQFLAENLRPGTYRLHFYEGNFSDREFKIPEGARGIVRLGTLPVNGGDE
ncbi:MAG: hypothetical protein ACXWQO_01390 [Bdellovibrionota bacterium]